MSHTADHAPSQPDREGLTPTGFKLVYAVRQAADVLCLGYSTVRERIASGELRSFKDGSRRLVAGEDLLAYVKARQDAA
jgi:excisionase family DNA binding protein